VTALDRKRGGDSEAGYGFWRSSEKQMKDASLLRAILDPCDGYKVVVGSSIARKFNLKVGMNLK